MTIANQFAPVWNASGVNFSAIRANVTDIASSGGSTLLDLRVNDSGVFSVNKTGAVTFAGNSLQGLLDGKLSLTGGTVSGQVLFSGTGGGLGLAQLASSSSNWFIYSGGTFQSPLFNCNGWFGMVDGASGGLQFFSGHGIVWSGSGTFGTLTRNSLTGDIGIIS